MPAREWLEQSSRRELSIAALAGGAIGLYSATITDPLPFAALLLAVAGAWLVSHPWRWIFVFFVSSLLLPPLPLPMGDSGVHPAIAVAALGFAAGVVRPAMWRIRAGLQTVAFCTFFFALLISVPFALLYSGPAIAAGSVARVGLFAVSIYVFAYLSYGPARSLRPESLIRWLYFAAVASAAFAVLDFYFQFPAPARFAPQFVWLSQGVVRRAQGVFYEASTLASFCSFFLTMIAVVVTQRFSRQLRIRAVWLLAGCAAFLVALIYSFSRAAIMNLAVSLLALAFLNRGFLSMRRIARLSFAAVAVTAGAVAAAHYVFPAFLSAFFQRLRYSAEFLLSDPNTILSQRLDSWSMLIQYLFENPLRSIFGIGYKTLPYTGFGDRPVVADNMYLSLLVETGWLGFGSLLLLNGVILYTSYRAATSEHAEISRFCGSWIFCFWCGEIVQMASGDILTYWRILPVFFAILALSLRHENTVL
jgi:hypothetical protein